MISQVIVDSTPVSWRNALKKMNELEIEDTLVCPPFGVVWLCAMPYGHKISRQTLIVSLKFNVYNDFSLFAQIEGGIIVYNNQAMAVRIKQQAKAKKITLKTMLPDLELNINLISQLSNGQNITAINLAKIADYLDCSVDYLLGRTNNPEVNK